MPTLSLSNRSRLLLRGLAYANDPSHSEGGTFASTGTLQVLSSDWMTVPVQQVHGGIPVVHGVRVVRIDPDGEPASFTGTTISVPPEAPVLPEFTAEQAVYAAFVELLGRGEMAPELSFTAAPPEVVARISQPSSPTVLRKAPFVEPILASLAIGVEGDRARLLWEVRLGLPEGRGVYVVHTTAGGRGDTPKVRSVRRLASHAARGGIFEYDPRETRISRPFPQPRDHYPVFGGGAVSRPHWMAADATEGNNLRACDSQGGTVRGMNAGSDLVFEPSDQSGIEQGIVNAFYLCNFLHDFFYLLGFDEAAGNFQQENPPGVGGHGDPLTVVVRERIVDGWAFFENRPDGTSPALELGLFHNSRHTALDADIIVHEFVHGVTNRVIGGKGVQAPLEHEQSLALGEGFSDYYAISLQNYYRRKAAQGAPEDSEEWSYAEWLTGGPPGLRTASYRDYPNTYGFIRGSRMKPHKAGEVWCATLLDLNRALGEGDRDVGDERGWQLVFDSLAFLHPGSRGPTYLHARDAIFCAYEALVQKGTIPGTAELRSAVCKVFQKRGMGGSATSDGARYRDARESFDPIDMSRAGGCT